MRNVRPAAALALLAAISGSAMADAATRKPKPAPQSVCNLITDAKGDVALDGAVPVSSAALDVTTADIASGPKTITAVIRVADLKADNYTQQGKEFKFVFAVGGSFYYLRVQSAPVTGDSFDYGTQPTATGSSTTVGDATGSFDPAKNTVTLTVNRSDIGIKKGAKFTDLLARSYMSAGAAYTPVDDAAGTKPYLDGTKSCVPAT